MESMFLAQLLGLYFILYGLIVMFRRRSVIPAIKDLSKSPGVILLFATVELAAGLAIVLSYPVVSLDVVGLISLIGYMLIIEGVVYLASPSKFIKKVLKRFNTSAWYVGGGVLAILMGVYLAGTGFGLF